MPEQVSYVLSVIVTTISDTLHPADAGQLRLCLNSLSRQVSPPAMEVIVPHLPESAAIRELKREFSGVQFLEIADLTHWSGQYGGREHHNELRARGICAARGAIIALTDDYSEVDPHWCRQIVEAHQDDVAGVAGAIELGSRGLLNAALFFCDFTHYQLPLTERESLYASDANASYKRAALESIRGIWRSSFEEMSVNYALNARNQRIILSPRLIVRHTRLRSDLRTALKERFVFGRSYGKRKGVTGARRWVWAALTPLLPVLILLRVLRVVLSKKRNLGLFLRALPFFGMLTAAWSLGELAGYLDGSRNEPEPTESREPRQSTAAAQRLSVVLATVGDGDPAAGTAELTAALDALQQQTVRPLEIIVPVSDPLLREPLRERYPAVTFLAVRPDSPPASSERVQELRSLGVAAAQGDLIAVTEDHVRADPEWAAETIQAHRQEYAALGGAIENGVDQTLNWATYFADLGRYHNPLPLVPTNYASVVNASYKRATLEGLRGVWTPRFHETAVHWAIVSGGEKLGFAPRAVVRQFRSHIEFGASLREFYAWGRSYGGRRAGGAGVFKRAVFVCAAPLIPIVLLTRSGLDVWRKKRLVGQWLKALPISIAVTMAWSCGELAGYVGGEAFTPQETPAASPKASIADSTR